MFGVQSASLRQRVFLSGAIAVFGLGIWQAPLSAHVVKRVEFNRDVRPIITKCFSCHGQDEKARMAGLRLDSRSFATALLRDGKQAIVPGHPERSELIHRVNAKGVDQMPPPSSNKFLTDDDRKVLSQWIAEGAEYKQHWAFVAPVRPRLPAVRLKSWPKGSLDTFVLAKLEENGLRPSPETDRRTLIRRASLDLLGLPPTPDDVEAFVKDKSPKAYEKVLDRLLASPRYGERMAMDWMDYSRYADSNGYQADFERYQWRWRDWVINAFNKDMPYDQFTIEQLAGDLLPHPTLDQRIATGFNRNHRINTEGGVIAEEWRVETVIDRVETTSETWLGLTAGCARCHDHKYDPISQKEFYALCSYFNNVPESGTGVEIPVNHPPVLKAPYPDQAVKMAGLDTHLDAMDRSLSARLSANAPRSVDWHIPPRDEPPSLKDGLVGRYKLADPPVAVAGQTPKVTGKVAFDPGRSSGAATTTDDAYLDLGPVGNFDTHESFSFGAWLNPGDGDGVPISRMDVAHDFRGWDLFLDGGRPLVHLISTWPTNALKVICKDTIPKGEWSHVAVTYDGSAKPEGIKIYINGKLREQDTEKNSLTGPLKTDVSAKIGRRTMTNPFNGRVDDAFIYSRALTPEEVHNLSDVSPAYPILSVPPEKRSHREAKLLNQLWSRANDPEYKAMDDDRQKVQAERDKLDSQITSVMVMQEMEQPRNAYVLVRGQYNKHGERVTAGIPAALPPLPKGVPNNRLGLAEWIVSPSNPLTARVAVNRMWERLFGAGLVGTIEDFGTRAEFPSHPELLDWLATEFVRLKWDQKAMWKEMMLSATYRQTSRVTPQLLKADPLNRLLSRGPRFRLPGEVIRDQALAASGLLVNHIGGPSVRPYQPDGIWDELNVYGNLRNYKHDMGAGLYRRSLYTIWKRTAAPPNMTLFDVPGRETCRVVRARTDTPLQALDLLNDVTYLEAARGLAARAIKEGGSDEAARIAFAFRQVLGRAPSSQETAILKEGLERRLSEYRNSPKKAEELISIGDLKRDPKMDVALLAAYTVTASTLLNLDETVTKE